MASRGGISLEPWVEDVHLGIPSWVGQTEHLRVTILPSVGSKMVSLLSLPSNREWLFQSSSSIGNRGYDTPFSESDGSGWDEMFPSIDACWYPLAPWKGVAVPDHGEVWSVPWQANVTDSGLCCRTRGVRFPYELKKTYSFIKSHILRIDYEVENLSSHQMSFLWAAHPLFNVPPGTRIEFPSVFGEMPQIEVAHSSGQRLGPDGAVLPWPTVQGANSTLAVDVVPSEDVTDVADKFYFKTWQSGEVSLVLPGQTERLRMRVDPSLVPYLAVWLNYAGYRNERNLALEPSTGWMDSLERAVETNRCTVVAPESTYHWWLEVECTLEV